MPARAQSRAAYRSGAAGAHDGRLTLALPKGRLLDDALELLRDLGVRASTRTRAG